MTSDTCHILTIVNRYQINNMRLFKFSLVGVLGFAVDIGTLYLIVGLFQITPLWARLPSWLLAVTTTYFLNIAFTFSESRRDYFANRLLLKRYMLYILSQLGGGLVNVSSYAAIMSFGLFPVYSVVAAGTLLGLLLNFLGASLALSGNRAAFMSRRENGCRKPSS